MVIRGCVRPRATRAKTEPPPSLFVTPDLIRGPAFRASLSGTPDQVRGDDGGKGWSYLFVRSEEHTSELQALLRLSYAVCSLEKKPALNAPYVATRYLNTQN